MNKILKNLKCNKEGDRSQLTTKPKMFKFILFILIKGNSIKNRKGKRNKNFIITSGYN